MSLVRPVDSFLVIMGSLTWPEASNFQRLQKRPQMGSVLSKCLIPDRLPDEYRNVWQVYGMCHNFVCVEMVYN